jgi:hypothetical protein
MCPWHGSGSARSGSPAPTVTMIGHEMHWVNARFDEAHDLQGCGQGVLWGSGGAWHSHGALPSVRSPIAATTRGSSPC